MQQVIDYLKKHIDAIILAFGGLVILSVLSIQFFMLNRTLIVSDEGWYLCLLRDVADYGNSRYQFLFHNMFDGDIFHARLFVWMLAHIAWIVLGLGIGDFVRKQTNPQHTWLPYAIGIISVYVGAMFIDSCPSPNYITLNRIAAAFSIGALLIGLARDKWYAYICSGFFLAALFPIMITNLVLLPIILIAVCIVSDNKWRDVGLFVLGFVLFFGFYFTFGESPETMLNYIMSKTSDSIKDPASDYGIMMWITWIGGTLLYLLKMFLMAMSCYIIYVCTNRSPIKKVYQIVILSIGIIAILLYYWKCLSPTYSFRVSHSVVWVKDLYWITLFVWIIDALYTHRFQSLQYWAVGVLLSITPICLCFGSDVPIITRQGMYWMFFIPVLTLFFGQLTNRKKYVLLIVFGINYLVFVTSIFRGNWNYESYLKSSVPVKSIGIDQNIKLEQKYINQLDFCQTVIPKGEEVFASNACWGHVVLLDYRPLSYNYYINSFDTIAHPENMYEFKVMEEKIKKDGYCWIMTAEWEQELQNSVRYLKGYIVLPYKDGNGYTYYRVTKPE